MSDQRWREIAVDDSFVENPRAWLANYAEAGKPWLLAHADDGVIWGKRQEDGTLALSSDEFDDVQDFPATAVDLDALTLQQARIFGPAGELLVWRVDNGFAARLIEDGPEKPGDALPDERHLLWGMGSDFETRGEFTLVREGQQGLCHAPPVRVAALRNGRRLALLVRNYLDYDEEGQAYVSLSRLVDFVPERRGT